MTDVWRELGYRANRQPSMKWFWRTIVELHKNKGLESRDLPILYQNSASLIVSLI
ncbi:MAG: hypothetical protein IPK53_19735 [bacterium]|nr:hypothetical protein [bacterium]